MSPHDYWQKPMQVLFFRWKHDQSRSEAFSQTNLKQLTHKQRSPIIHESNSLWSIAKKKKQILILKGLQGLGCWVQNMKELRALYKIFKETKMQTTKISKMLSRVTKQRTICKRSNGTFPQFLNLEITFWLDYFDSSIDRSEGIIYQPNFNLKKLSIAKYKDQPRYFRRRGLHMEICPWYIITYYRAIVT